LLSRAQEVAKKHRRASDPFGGGLPKEILFLSDILAELDAAAAAG